MGGRLLGWAGLYTNARESAHGKFLFALATFFNGFSPGQITPVGGDGPCVPARDVKHLFDEIQSPAGAPAPGPGRMKRRISIVDLPVVEFRFNGRPMHLFPDKNQTPNG